MAEWVTYLTFMVERTAAVCWSYSSNPGGEKKYVCVYLPSLSYKCYMLLYVEFMYVFLSLYIECQKPTHFIVIFTFSLALFL